MMIFERLNIYILKATRRVINPLRNWYNYYSFVSGLKKHGKDISVKGSFDLWCDNVSVGDFVNVYPNVIFWGPGEISIGNNVELGASSVIYSSKKVNIEENVLIAAQCYIIDSNHAIDISKLIREQDSTVKGPVTIKEGAWLGAGVKVLSGVTIGKGAVIGAQSLVNKDIPDYAIAVGVPAKIIGYRK